jgi:hypothetical protein
MRQRQYPPKISPNGPKKTAEGKYSVEPVGKAKLFSISKREVWEAFKRVKANQGAAGVDGQSILEFEVNLSGTAA